MLKCIFLSIVTVISSHGVAVIVFWVMNTVGFTTQATGSFPRYAIQLLQRRYLTMDLTAFV